ncbi:uncharacterized protein [Venturia canescens]|uniref:uncharacterized protein n=1 Tax=Venturia canescens TaxID=32260 RepID=UPI001C9CC95B|nr:uncharacterized protein LOC122408585 [Venturia canescens]
MELQFTKIFTLLAYIAVAGSDSRDAQLWCYQCNSEPGQSYSSQCNDPYFPVISTDLVACPRNDSYICLKSLINYRNVHVTVRGCVLRSQKSTYCSFKEAYPEAKLECLYCDGYACNASHKSTSLADRYVIAASLIIFVTFSRTSWPLISIT